jgi:VanZ family protein
MDSSQLEHVAAYFLTAGALALGHHQRRSLVTTVIVLPIYAAVLELLQLWVPGRMPRLIDIIAGAAGTWTGVALCALYLSSRAARLDRPMR